MFKTISSCALLACVVLAGSVSPAYAQRQAPAFGGAMTKQTINIQFGWFIPKGADSLDGTSVDSSRAANDVLVANSTFLCTATAEPNCPFDIGSFSSFAVGGEWLLPVANVLEFGAGVSYSSKTVPTVYRDFTDSDGTEIDSDSNLRLVPLSFTVRILPLGQRSKVQPYVGGGLGLFWWHYSESGEFIDFTLTPAAVFEDTTTYNASGWSFGPIVLGGLRYATERYAVGGEVRYHWAVGDLDPFLFAGTTDPADPQSKIDLGGWIFQGTFGFRF